MPNGYDIATLILTAIGAAAIIAAALLMSGCSNSSPTVTGNSVQITVHILPLAP